MSIKQLTVITMAMILTTFTLGATADSNDKDNPGKTGHDRQAPNSHNKYGWGSKSPDVKIVIRENKDWGKDDNRGNENSNRQSDSDSDRGQERAEERRSDNADQYEQSGRERHWYDFLFVENRDQDHELTEKKLHWWWPFN